jgi:hypothetical protein
MALKQRIISEIYDDQTGNIYKRDIVEDKIIKSPKSIEDLGYNHEEQLEILKHIQESFLKSQSEIFELPDTCPECGSKLNKTGPYISKFNSVFTDHKISLSKMRCCNKDCKRILTFSIQGLFGDYRHPDLLKMQTQLSSKMSFVEAQKQLDAISKNHRSVNGQINLKRSTDKIGEILGEIHQDESLIPKYNITSANELIVQADGGYIKDKYHGRGNFEMLLTKIYKPENNKDGEITEKSYVASSYKDHHRTIKAMTLMSAKKEGLTKDTNIIALADGAKNCWNILKSLKKHCNEITYILDWYHISNKFDKLIKQCSNKYSEAFESVKWKIWHGNTNEAIVKLSELYTDLITTDFADKTHDLLKYIANNKEYLINYAKRHKDGLVFTSSAIEIGVEHVINTRFKKKHKAQWNRESAHKLVQIRTSIASNDWSVEWDMVKEKLYKNVA